MSDQNPNSEQKKFDDAEIIEFLKLTNMVNSQDKIFQVSYDNFKSGRVAFCLGTLGFHFRIYYSKRNVETFNETIGITEKKDMFIDICASVKKYAITGIEIDHKKSIIQDPKNPETQKTVFVNDLHIFTVNKTYIIPSLDADTARNYRTQIWQWTTS